MCEITTAFDCCLMCQIFTDTKLIMVIRLYFPRLRNIAGFVCQEPLFLHPTHISPEILACTSWIRPLI